jgi:hypothetical protein
MNENHGVYCGKIQLPRRKICGSCLNLKLKAPTGSSTTTAAITVNIQTFFRVHDRHPIQSVQFSELSAVGCPLHTARTRTTLGTGMPFLYHKYIHTNLEACPSPFFTFFTLPSAYTDTVNIHSYLSLAIRHTHSLQPKKALLLVFLVPLVFDFCTFCLFTLSRSPSANL